MTRSVDPRHGAGSRLIVYGSLLCSPRLDEAAWRELDAFEGPAYRRIVVPFFGAPGEEPVSWGQVYAAAEPREIGS